MKYTWKIVSIILVLLCMGCEEDELEHRIIGRWVEDDFKTDTLIFESRGNLLKIRTANSQHLDFLYEIEGDSISFNWVYSSDIKRYNFHYFKVDNNQLNIENFYVDSLQSNSLLKFNKIEI